MPGEYTQNTGELKHDGATIAHGYSGHASWKNNPSVESTGNVDPIPKGHYRINGYNNYKGPFIVILEPIVGTNTFGRSAFSIFGDNPASVGNSSEGCIIINGVSIRQNIVNSSDTILVVR